MFALIGPFFASALLCVAGLALLATQLAPSFLAAKHHARSNHTTTARQIGGLAMIPAALITMLYFRNSFDLDPLFVTYLSVGCLMLWLTGLLDDRFELSVLPRLGAQIIASIIVTYGFSVEFRLLPQLLPLWLEAPLIVLTLLTAINITNFMDGLDLMTVSGVGIPLFGAVLLSALGLASLQTGGLAAIMVGALLSFGLFNRPPARLFLGDSGSLPLGLFTGIVFLLLAKETGIFAALLLPLYYLADSISTMLIRAWNRENIFSAHSRHAYQLAKRSGRSVINVIAHVAALNLILVCCGLVFIAYPTLGMRLGCFGFGLIATIWLLLRFRGRI